jgi:hypothetical protein
VTIYVLVVCDPDKDPVVFLYDSADAVAVAAQETAADLGCVAGDAPGPPDCIWYAENATEGGAVWIVGKEVIS